MFTIYKIHEFMLCVGVGYIYLYLPPMLPVRVHVLELLMTYGLENTKVYLKTKVRILSIIFIYRSNMIMNDSRLFLRLVRYANLSIF